MGKTVLVIGGSGLVGSAVVEHCRERGHDVTATYLSNPTDATAIRLDETDADAVQDVVRDVAPDAIVDAAAFTDVDGCEQQRRDAFDANVSGTRNAAVAAEEVGAHLVHLSSDYVFAGEVGSGPYREGHPVQPPNFYGETKLAGEVAARICREHTILRTSVVYGAAGSNFATWALEELASGGDLRIVDDQISAPTHVHDLARAMADVIEGGVTGTYHATGPEPISRHEFVRRLAATFGYDPSRVEAISTAELGQEAARPPDSTLDSRRLYDALGWRFSAPSHAFELLRRSVSPGGETP